MVSTSLTMSTLMADPELASKLAGADEFLRLAGVCGSGSWKDSQWIRVFSHWIREGVFQSFFNVLMILVPGCIP